ncbi:MAG: PAS-domain containing protein [Rhodospirillales bacterium]|nr:PAS-domain containing protein [Rhodospirillales bacterium]
MWAVFRRNGNFRPWLMVVAVVCLVAIIEGARRYGLSVPIPFLLLYVGVVLGGNIGGVLGGGLCGGIAAAYVIYAAIIGFGPSTLTGGAVQTLAGCLLYLGTGLLVGRVSSQRDQLLKKIKEQEVSRREAVLSNLTQGVAVYDTDLTLVSFNDRFLKILQLPPELAHEGTPLAEIIRYRAERGDYGKGDIDEIVSGRLRRAQFDGERAAERTLPDGGVYVHHRKPLPDGGCVTTYTDITALRQAERARAQSEDLFRKTFENSGVGIMMRSLPDRKLTTNAASLKMLGYSQDELQSMHLKDITHPDDWKEHAESRKQLFTGSGGSRQVVKRYYRKDGKIIWLALDSLVIRDESGAVTTTVNLFQDVTAAKVAEQEIIRKTALLENSMEAMAQAYAVFDSDGKLVAHNANFQTIFDFPKDFLGPDCALRDIVRHRLMTENYGDNSNVLGDLEEEVIRRADRYLDGSPTKGERVTATGRTYFFNRMPMPDGGTVSTYTDVTDFRKAEMDLRASEAKFRGAFENAGVGIYIRTADGKSREFNAAFCKMLGYTQEEMNTIKLRDLAHPDDDPNNTSVRFVALDSDNGSAIERRFIRKDGQVVWCAISYRQVCDAQGQPVSTIAMCQDITGRKDAEQKLQQAQKMEAVGQLTGGIAHDFNNLLAVSLGNIELARDAIGGGEDPQAFLDSIQRANERGALLTRQLLAFSRKQTLHPQIVDAGELVSTMTSMLKTAMGESVVIDFIKKAGLWSCEVDANQLTNAILNLAINARDAMPQGGRLTIQTSNVRFDDDYVAAQGELTRGEYVLLMVTDTGSGMSREVVEKAFDPFFSS